MNCVIHYLNVIEFTQKRGIKYLCVKKNPAILESPAISNCKPMSNNVIIVSSHEKKNRKFGQTPFPNCYSMSRFRKHFQVYLAFFISQDLSTRLFYITIYNKIVIAGDIIHTFFVFSSFA